MQYPIKQLLDAKLLIERLQCFKNFGSPTRVAELKVAGNMTDPNSLMKIPCNLTHIFSNSNAAKP